MAVFSYSFRRALNFVDLSIHRESSLPDRQHNSTKLIRLDDIFGYSLYCPSTLAIACVDYHDRWRGRLARRSTFAFGLKYEFEKFFRSACLLHLNIPTKSTNSGVSCLLANFTSPNRALAEVRKFCWICPAKGLASASFPFNEAGRAITS